MFKEPCNLIGRETQLVTPNQKQAVSGTAFPWWLTSCKKTDSFDLLILSRDIGDQRILQSAQLSTSNKRRKSQKILILLNDCHHAEILRNSNAIFLQGILAIKEFYNLIGQEMKLTPPYRVVESDFNILWQLSPCKKSKRSIDSSQSYCYLIGWGHIRP